MQIVRADQLGRVRGRSEGLWRRVQGQFRNTAVHQQRTVRGASPSIVGDSAGESAELKRRVVVISFWSQLS